MIYLKNSFWILHSPLFVFTIFFLPQEINPLFPVLGLLQNFQEFTPAPSDTVHSLTLHSITRPIRIKHKLSNQGRSDGGGYRDLYPAPLPPKKKAQVNFLWGKNDARTAIQQFYTPKKLIPPKNKFLATPLLAIGPKVHPVGLYPYLIIPNYLSCCLLYFLIDDI